MTWPKAWSGRFYGQLGRAHFNLFRDIAGNEGEVYFQLLVGLQLYVFLLRRLKALRLYGNRVNRHRQKGQYVMA